MSAKQVSKNPASKQALSQFLAKTRQLPQRTISDSRPSNRMIFALDATASRQPSWDRACQLQSEMFLATNQLGGIQLQLCYYRGFNEFHHSPWLQDSAALQQTMNAVQCLGGYTQIERVLTHALRENSAETVKAVIIIADAVEEGFDLLCEKAGQLGMMKIPIFIFQEGFDKNAKDCFQQLAKLSNGAYANFNEQSAQHLSELLGAVATYAAGGRSALERLNSTSARQLLQQLRR